MDPKDLNHKDPDSLTNQEESGGLNTNLSNSQPTSSQLDQANVVNNKQVNGNSDLVSKARSFLQQKKQDGMEKGGLPKKNISVKGAANLLDALLSKGLITLDQFNSIKFESINSGKTIEQIVVEQNIASEKDIARINAEIRGYSFADLLNMNIDSDTIHVLPQSVAKINKAVVFEVLPNKVKVAMKDPLDLQKIQYLESILNKRVEPFFAAESDINKVIDTRYGAEINKEVTEALEDIKEYDLNKAKREAELADNQDAPIIRLVNMILDYGIKNKASDIHIEPRETKVAVRFRIRGILTEKLTIPKKLHAAVVTRIKILSNLKIDEHRVPQDGRFPVKTNDVTVDVRVSVMPSIYGEKIVLRLLEKSSGIMKLEETGIRGISYTRLKESLKKTQGLILITGPTGSGKTQTVASCLEIINSPEVNVITLEDPVEIRIEGINQTQVNPEVGLTFATGLRSILRQDPDIIFVGEIRDSETASLAVQAALVGRLVLSTLHTNSAAGVFPRLLDMGVEVFLLISTINVAVGQRLVRTLCNECKEPYKAPEDIVEILHSELDSLNSFTVYGEDKKPKVRFDKDIKDITLYKPVGCSKCNDSGFVGRIGIFECLEMSDNIRKAVVERKSMSEIQKIAMQEGMITMVQDGFIRALEGVTTIEEVLRVKNE
jgi:type IV pilus assembly protein PilB